LIKHDREGIPAVDAVVDLHGDKHLRLLERLQKAANSHDDSRDPQSGGLTLL
jgi:hypothetical protein